MTNSLSYLNGNETCRAAYGHDHDGDEDPDGEGIVHRTDFASGQLLGGFLSYGIGRGFGLAVGDLLGGGIGRLGDLIGGSFGGSFRGRLGGSLCDVLNGVDGLLGLGQLAVVDDQRLLVLGEGIVQSARLGGDLLEDRKSVV